jgi:DNA ligase D-like protein (predicted ligase)
MTLKTYRQKRDFSKTHEPKGIENTQNNAFEILQKANPAPMPQWQEPMLATLTYSYFSHDDWLYECKFDGERCLTYYKPEDGVVLYSRNKQVLNTVYPELTKALMSCSSKSFIVDGEIIAFNEQHVSSFSKLQGRIGIQKPTKEDIDRTPVYYYVFDILYFDQYDLRGLPLIERKSILREVILFNEPINYTEHKLKEGLRYYKFACSKNWEGVIAKNIYSTYQNQRLRDWLKFKHCHQQEFVIIGYTEPKSSRLGLGALLIGYYDKQGGLHYAGKVGTGFNRDTLKSIAVELASLKQGSSSAIEQIKEQAVHWVKPELVCEIGFTEWTKDKKLRHPRYIGLRMDKDPKEIFKET